MYRAIALCLILVGAGLAPLAGAYHLSVGNQDGVALQPSETPTSPSVSEADRQRGLETNCYESDASGSADDLQAAAASDAFCGRLVYDQGTEYQQASTSDQDIPAGSGLDLGFDVVYASYVGNYGLSWNCPWCLSGGRAAYETIHDVGAAAGLTPTGEEAWRGDQGWFEAAANTLYPNALIVANEATGAWEMNGWVHTIHDMQFIGFLNDAGQAVDQDTLDTLVNGPNGLKAQGVLPSGANAQVCGFTPDWTVAINAAQATFCEVLFRWAEEDNAAGFGGDYQDPCSSPAYLCGAFTEAWYAQLVCKSIPYTSSGWGCANEDGGFPEGDAPAWSDNDYDVWHFVVAPTVSACNGAQEPGFTFDPSDGSVPYLAHDLDVYSPAATAAGLQSTESVQDAVVAFQEQTVDNLDQAIDDAVPSLPPALDEAVDGAVDTAINASYAVLKDSTLEPNADGDTSRSAVVILRDIASDPCLAIVEGVETPETVDPWVNYLDSFLWQDWVAFGLTPVHADPTANAVQDENNHPGPGFFYSDGQVGIFTDKNDDGDYDDASTDSMFQDIYSVGHYPMFWDLWLDEVTLEPDLGAGCGLGFTDKKLTEEMVNAGYGIHTGLVQVVYLQEPTVLRYDPGNDVIPFLDGDNAFVLISQGLRALYHAGDADAVAAVEAALTKLPAQPANVVLPGDLIGTDSDFDDQCGDGDFGSDWTWFHDTTLAGSDDTIVTSYVFEVASSDGVIGGSSIPTFEPGGEPYAFGAGIHQWFDVDPFDGDPARNHQSEPPPEAE